MSADSSSLKSIFFKYYKRGIVDEKRNARNAEYDRDYLKAYTFGRAIAKAELDADEAKRDMNLKLKFLERTLA